VNLMTTHRFTISYFVFIHFSEMNRNYIHTIETCISDAVCGSHDVTIVDEKTIAKEILLAGR